MRVVPEPGPGEAMPDPAWHAELDAALRGEGAGSLADYWRELNADLRALAPQMSSEFECELRERIAARRAGPRRRRLPLLGPAPTVGPALAADALADDALASDAAVENVEPARRSAWSHPLARRATAAIVTATCAIAGVLVAAPWRSGAPQRTPSSAVVGAANANAGRARGNLGTSGPSRVAGAATPTPLQKGAATSAPAHGALQSAPAQGLAGSPVGAAEAGLGASSAGRVQQLAASISLTTSSSELQEVADRAARLTVADGGFVQSAHVQVQPAGTSEANLDLVLPSVKLSAALASLGELAPVRTESQSLQDITNAYDAAQRRLADALAERRALLRALSRAVSEGQIDSLHERLAVARRAIAQANSELQAVSHRASTAEVEVTVFASAHATGEAFTLQRGLKDAGHVLLVTLAVLLVGAAVLAPLALLLAALVLGRARWRSYQRERALEGD